HENLFLIRLSIFCLQAEVGIRDRNVTGVQTCALPIFSLYGCRTWNGRILGRSWYRNATSALETDSIDRSYYWIISYRNAIYWYCAGKSHFCPNRPLYDTCRWSVNGRHRRTNVFLGI